MTKAKSAAAKKAEKPEVPVETIEIDKPDTNDDWDEEAEVAKTSMTERVVRYAMDNSIGKAAARREIQKQDLLEKIQTVDGTATREVLAELVELAL